MTPKHSHSTRVTTTPQTMHLSHARVGAIVSTCMGCSVPVVTALGRISTSTTATITGIIKPMHRARVLHDGYARSLSKATALIDPVSRASVTIDPVSRASVTIDPVSRATVFDNGHSCHVSTATAPATLCNCSPRL